MAEALDGMHGNRAESRAGLKVFMARTCECEGRPWFSERFLALIKVLWSLFYIPGVKFGEAIATLLRCGMQLAAGFLLSVT